MRHRSSPPRRDATGIGCSSGIDVLDARPDAAAFIRGAGWDYPSIFDPTGEIRDRLGVLGQPVTLYYDGDGHLVDTNTGPVTADVLQRQLSQLVA